MFVYSDGVIEMLDGDPTYENRFLARAAWKAFRADVWHLWAEWGERRPPTGAVAHDGLTDRFWQLPPHPTSQEVREAAQGDLDSIRAWRAANHAAADEIEEELADLEADLRFSVAVAEEAGDGELPRYALDPIRRRRTAPASGQSLPGSGAF